MQFVNCPILPYYTQFPFPEDKRFLDVRITRARKMELDPKKMQCLICMNHLCVSLPNRTAIHYYYGKVWSAMLHFLKTPEKSR